MGFGASRFTTLRLQDDFSVISVKTHSKRHGLQISTQERLNTIVHQTFLMQTLHLWSFQRIFELRDNFITKTNLSFLFNPTLCFVFQLPSEYEANPELLLYRITHLNHRQQYLIWAAAVTTAGRGNFSDKVTVEPAAKGESFYISVTLIRAIKNILKFHSQNIVPNFQQKF